MFESIRETVAALAQSSKFISFFDGAHVELSDGRRLKLQIKETYRSFRPVGLRLSRFAFVTTVVADDITGFGYGEANSKLLAIQKSISEAVERVVYKAMKTTSIGTSNSNGWAAHVDKPSAQNSAFMELVERDAVLTHWLCRKPLVEINPATFPAWLKSWTTTELSQSSSFKHLRILVTQNGFVPTIMTVLLNDVGNGVISHASHKTIETALFQALTESCRIAQIVQDPMLIEKSSKLISANEEKTFLPEDHAAVYAHHLAVPSWMFGHEMPFHVVRDAWKEAYDKFSPMDLGLKFHTITRKPLWVGYATSERTQGLYFGRTSEAAAKGLLNLSRLRSVMPTGEFNPLPHCVP